MRTLLLIIFCLLLLPAAIAQTVPLILEVESDANMVSPEITAAVREINNISSQADSVAVEMSQPIPITGMAAAQTKLSRSNVALWVLLGIAIFLVVLLVWRR